MRNLTPASSPWQLQWRDRDDHRWLTYLTLTGVAGAVGLATVGLPPLDIHSPWHFMGIMDPLCGMTRATRALAMGEIATAIRYNPASPLLPGGAGLVLTRALIAWRTGRWLGFVIVWRRSAAVLAIVLVALLWWHQQANAELLMRFGMP